MYKIYTVLSKHIKPIAFKYGTLIAIDIVNEVNMEQFKGLSSDEIKKQLNGNVIISKNSMLDVLCDKIESFFIWLFKDLLYFLFVVTFYAVGIFGLFKLAVNQPFIFIFLTVMMFMPRSKAY